MLQRIIAVVALVAAAASAQTVRLPATRPSSASARSLTRDALDALHEQSLALMRDEQYDKAFPLLEKVYSGTPAGERSRSLVLNHAILDLVQKKFAMRGVRDVLDYLSKHRVEDEFATNVLGSLLDVAAGEEPKLKNSALWTAALKEWERRNYILDHNRPGWHRFGVKWITEEEYQARESEKEELRRAIVIQMERVDRVVFRADGLVQQAQNAARQSNTYLGLRRYLADVRNDPNATWYEKAKAVENTGDYLKLQMDAWISAQEIQGDLALALRELAHEQNQLRDLEKQLDAQTRPAWPMRYDPVDPKAPVPGPTTLPLARPPAPTQPPLPPTPIGVELGPQVRGQLPKLIPAPSPTPGPLGPPAAPAAPTTPTTVPAAAPGATAPTWSRPPADLYAPTTAPSN